MTSQNNKNSDVSNHAAKAATGLLSVTGFLALSTQTGLAQQMVKTIDQKLTTSISASVLPEDIVAEIDANAIRADYNRLMITQGKATVLDGNNALKVAPDGTYKLSNGLLLSIKSGEVTKQTALTKDIINDSLDLGAAPWCDMSFPEDGPSWTRWTNSVDDGTLCPG